jgi:hypothetical protein
MFNFSFPALLLLTMVNKDMHSFREDLMPETRIPLSGVLGNWTSGEHHTGFRIEAFWYADSGWRMEAAHLGDGLT